MKYDYINLQEYDLSNAAEYVEMIAYTFVSFFVPLFIRHPQIAVGIVVNAMLITAALNVRGYKLLPVIIAPSLGALAGGFLFGPLTVFLLYLIPFIWIGNAILVFGMKLLKLKYKMNFWISLAISAGAKAGFLFLSAFVLYRFGVVPVIFLTAMGIVQLATAIGGGVGAFGFQYAKKKVMA